MLHSHDFIFLVESHSLASARIYTYFPFHRSSNSFSRSTSPAVDGEWSGALYKFVDNIEIKVWLPKHFSSSTMEAGVRFIFLCATYNSARAERETLQLCVSLLASCNMKLLLAFMKNCCLLKFRIVCYRKTSCMVGGESEWRGTR